MKKSITDIGHTPLIELKNIEKKYHLSFHLYAKLEMNNATGSIKDRPALSIIKHGLEEGKINQDSIIVEATSGNMGISFAFIAREYHLKCKIFMPKSASKERRDIMSSYGAELELVDGGMAQAVEEAIKYCNNEPHAFYCDQFKNKNNPLAHYETTSLEIIKELGETPDYFFAGIGTSGTLMGNAKRFLENNKDVNIIGIEPEESPLITKGEAHPHLIQGIGANFVPDIYNKNLVKKVLTVSSKDAYEGARILKREENIFAGITSGCNLMGVINNKEFIRENSNVVIILPDSGDRYLSVENLYE